MPSCTSPCSVPTASAFLRRTTCSRPDAAFCMSHQTACCGNFHPSVWDAITTSCWGAKWCWCAKWCGGVSRREREKRCKTGHCIAIALLLAARVCVCIPRALCLSVSLSLCLSVSLSLTRAPSLSRCVSLALSFTHTHTLSVSRARTRSLFLDLVYMLCEMTVRFAAFCRHPTNREPWDPQASKASRPTSARCALRSRRLQAQVAEPLSRCPVLLHFVLSFCVCPFWAFQYVRKWGSVQNMRSA